MRIALCDDEISALDSLETFLRSYCDEHKLNFVIDRFSSGEALLASPQPYDVIFMDIYLTGINGTDVVRQLSAANRPQVVFTTTSREHAIEAFGLGAVHYLLKPLTRESVSEAADRCLARLGQGSAKVLQVRTSQGTVPVPMDNITYIEVFNKICVIHTAKNTIQTYASLDGLFELLDARSFLRAQRSYIVNMNFIDSFLSNRLILEDGTEITLSRNNRVELKKQYQQFLFDLARRNET